MMLYQNKTAPRMPKPELKMPDSPGYFWAKWRIPEDGTEDEDNFISIDRWECVEVTINSYDDTKDNFVVLICGVAKAQSLENFVWRKPIKAIQYPDN